MKPPAFDYRRPDGLADALALLAGAGDDAKLLAGGQSLGPMLNLRLARPALLIDVSRLAELTRVREDDEGLTLGAAVTHSAVEDGEVPDVAGGLLSAVAGRISYRAVRNQGTVGGSLAHADPAGDWAPVMMALGARAAIEGPGGARELPVAELIEDVLTTSLARDEILVSLRIPRLAPGARWGQVKLCRKPGKFADAIAVVVADEARGVGRVAIAGPTAPPRLLAGASAAVAGLASWTDGAEAELREAVAAEIDAHPDIDRFQRRLHAASVVRAARQAVAS